jgi:hypothetical protein
MLNQETPQHQSFHRIEKDLLDMKFDSMTERRILKHWQIYEPKKVEDLLSKQMLKQTLTLTAEALLDMQIALMEQEKLNPALAQSEAWNRLMRIEEDEAEEAEAWGMTLEEYRNRP